MAWMTGRNKREGRRGRASRWRVRAACAGLVLAVAATAPRPSAAARADEQTTKSEADRKSQGASKEAKKELPPEKPLRFTDDDLARFHGRQAPETGDEEGEASEPAGQAPTEGSAPARPPAPGPKPVATPPAQAMKPVATPPAPAPETAATPPAQAMKPAAPGPAVPRVPEDPLQAHREKELKEAQRASRVSGLRAKIDALETRLTYLRDKRQAILDPYRVMPQARTAEDRQRDSDLKPAELLGTVDEEIRSTETGLRDAQEELVAVQLRFLDGGPGGP